MAMITTCLMGVVMGMALPMIGIWTGICITRVVITRLMKNMNIITFDALSREEHGAGDGDGWINGIDRVYGDGIGYLWSQ